jgi:phosphoglycerate dehydrogenase-like enzyme
MPAPAEIVIVWPADKEFVIAPIERGLQEAGHRVTRYSAFADATAQGDRLLAFADVVLPFPSFRFAPPLFANAPRLRAAISPVTGVDGIDLTAASAHTVIVGNTLVDESHESMAEATVLLMLSCLYDLKGTEAILRNNLPSRQPVATMAKGKTVGMIGFGQIARAVAERLQGWQVELQTYAPRLRAPLPAQVRRVELDDLLRTSDIVLVLAALNMQTRGLIGAERLALLKPGVILINTARGEIVDEKALVAHAKAGKLRALALDVFETEPLAANHPLRELPNAILTGHAIGHTVDTIAAMPQAALENVARVLRGEPPLSVKNPEILPAWQAKWRV